MSHLIRVFLEIALVERHLCSVAAGRSHSWFCCRGWKRADICAALPLCDWMMCLCVCMREAVIAVV